jgi:hypothetical protein
LLFKPQVIPPPGLPDIKWNELYSNWVGFVPEDRKQGLKYFVEEPPASLKKAIAAHGAEARSARNKRSRAGDSALGTPTKKKDSYDEAQKGVETCHYKKGD